MKVLDARVLLKIEELEAPVTKIGDIEIKEEKPQWEKGEVIEFGENCTGLEKGDKVFIYPGSGKSVKVDGQDYRVVSSSEIIVVL